ncbi:hypothetical protein [Streptomyces sp. NPDC051000]|uniref:hypothetical protein n=1 Tax=Streptomyces sp. NPDC051000 TaxID=3155520 RepID=UPI00340BCAC4
MPSTGLTVTTERGLIEANKAGETVEKAEPTAEPTGVVDLMEALRASVERAGSPKATGGKATAPGHRADARFGTINVEVDTELAKLDPAGYRPLRARRRERPV